MGPADDIEGKARASALWASYGQRVDNESAREMLAARSARPAAAPDQQAEREAAKSAPSRQHQEAATAMGGGVAAVTAFLQSGQGKQRQKEVVRGVFGLLKKKF